MRNLTVALLFLASATMGNGQSSAPASNKTFATWPCALEIARLQLPPGASRQIGFDLPAEAAGKRVVVAFRAWLETPAAKESQKATGYTTPLVIEVNGEVFQARKLGEARLLNKPMRFHFGPDGKNSMEWAEGGQLDTVSYSGCARWAVPCAPSFTAVAESSDYSPKSLDDPAYFVIDISDMVEPGHYNSATIKHEGEKGTLFLEELKVQYGGNGPDRSRDAAIRAARRALKERYFSRAAVAREGIAGHEWAHDMTMLTNYGETNDPLREIRTIEEARERIKSLREGGGTVVVVDGLHFRHDFTDLRETRILPYLKLLCQAAHEQGFRVIDHHDVPLFFSRGYPFLLEDNHLEWTQRDIRYGTPTRAYCLNNPGFRDHYFTWMRRAQKECGIDGYMVDEAVFFEDSFCGCEHCRGQFRSETGFELPRAPDSTVFQNDGDPLWQLFTLWRRTSIQRFKCDLMAEIHKENPNAIYVCYTSTYDAPDVRGGFWPSVFVTYATGCECMSRVPFQNYRCVMADMRLRRGLADAFDHASWVLFYPLDASTARFCWGMAQATAQSQWHLSDRASDVESLVNWPDAMRKADFTTYADVAMIFSEDSKNYSMRNGQYHGMESIGWGIAMIDASIQYHHIMEIAVTPELLARYRVVLLPHMAQIAPATAAALEAYVRNGGKLVVTGLTGVCDEFGLPLRDFQLAKMMGASLGSFHDAPFDVAEADGRTFRYDRERMLYRFGMRFIELNVAAPAASRVLVRFMKDGKEYPGILEAPCGKGKVYTVAGFLGISNYEATLQEGEKQIFRFNPDAHAFMGRWLRGILGDGERIAPVNVPPGIVYTSYIRHAPANELDVHFLNVQDNTRVVDVPVQRREVAFSVVKMEMQLLVRGFNVQAARLCAPGLPEPAECQIRPEKDGALITIPAGTMSLYGLLKITGVAQ